MRRIAMLIGTVAGVALGMLIATTWLIDTTAQDATEVSFDVTWGPLDETFNDRCRRHRSLDESPPPAMFNGFSEVITIRDAQGDIVSMTALRDGSLQRPTTSTGVPICRITIAATLDQGDGHTIWLDDRYLASIPPDGLPDLASIVLEDWD